MKSTVIVSLIVLAVIAGVVYKSVNKSEASKMGTGNTDNQVMEEKPADSLVQVNEIVVEGSSFKFEPSDITLKKGEKTRIIFKNTGGMHDFRVDELGIKTEILDDGGEQTVEFTPVEAGTFEYYCSVGEHRKMGMVGTLVVTE